MGETFLTLLVIDYALTILPYLVLRSAELRGGRWALDLGKLRIVPAVKRENVKDSGGMKMRIAISCRPLRR